MVRPVSNRPLPSPLQSPASPRGAVASDAPAAAPASTPAGSLAAPPGASPALWSLLTAEERSFFFEMASLGPVTYRSGGRPAESAPAPLGQRIDVRG